MYKLFLSAVEYLPFSSLDASKASCEEIIERFGDFRRQLAIECINFQIFRLYSWIYCKCVHLMQGSVKITTNQTQEVRWGFFWYCTTASLAVTSKGNGYSVALLHTTDLYSRLWDYHREAFDTGIDA
jgi:hypothetical protein